MATSAAYLFMRIRLLQSEIVCGKIAVEAYYSRIFPVE
jgi:hypothetical protein